MGVLELTIGLAVCLVLAIISPELLVTLLFAALIGLAVVGTGVILFRIHALAVALVVVLIVGFLISLFGTSATSLTPGLLFDEAVRPVQRAHRLAVEWVAANRPGPFGQTVGTTGSADGDRVRNASARIPTTATLTLSVTRIAGTDGRVTLSAFVTAGAGTDAPDGPVEFWRGTRSLGRVDLSKAPGGATAESTIRGWPDGEHVLTAVYLGSPRFAPSRSQPVLLSVAQP